MRTCLFRCLVGEFPVLLTGWVRLNVSRVPCGRCVGVLPSLLRSMCRLMSWLMGWLRQCRSCVFAAIATVCSCLPLQLPRALLEFWP